MNKVKTVRGVPVTHGYMNGNTWVNTTVQCCPECQKGMAWDEAIKEHIPRDDYEFKHWTGVSPDLMRRCWQAVDLDGNPDVCANNIVRLLPMGEHEVRMIRVLLRHLKAAENVKTIRQDIFEYEDIIVSWQRLARKAKKVFPTLTVVQECKINETP